VRIEVQRLNQIKHLSVAMQLVCMLSKLLVLDIIGLSQATVHSAVADSEDTLEQRGTEQHGDMDIL
jgi:hypothetical protein